MGKLNSSKHGKFNTEKFLEAESINKHQHESIQQFLEAQHQSIHEHPHEFVI